LLLYLSIFTLVFFLFFFFTFLSLSIVTMTRPIRHENVT